MSTLKQSTAYSRSFLMVKTSDHITGSTGQSTQISLVLYKGGSTSSSTAAAAILEQGFGWYVAQFTSADLNVAGDMVVHATSSSGSADPTDWSDQVQAQIFTDLLIDTSGRVKILNNIQQGAASNGFVFPMTSTGTGQLQPGLTVSAQRTLGAGGFASCASSVVEVGGGWYAINLQGTDTNAANIGLQFTAAGANTLTIPLSPTP